MQNRAIDVLIRRNDPETIRYLMTVLKDENEYARRAAVEVLNEIGDAKSVKFLLEAIKDDDWWVRSRAGDALGKIGGPKVIDAVLELVRDKDENIRRAAIEILNQTKDERAVQQPHRGHAGHGLVGQRARRRRAGRDRQPRPCRACSEMLQTAPAKALPIVVRADRQARRRATRSALLMPLLDRTEKEIRVEAIARARQARQRGPRRPDQRAAAGTGQQPGRDHRAAAQRAMTESRSLRLQLPLLAVSGTRAVGGAGAAPPARSRHGPRVGRAAPTPQAGTARTLLIPEKEIAQTLHQAAQVARAAPRHRHPQARAT